MAETNVLTIASVFWAFFYNFKVFAKMLYPLIKFIEKYGGDVGEVAQPTIFELYPNFGGKWGPEQLEIS